MRARRRRAAACRRGAERPSTAARPAAGRRTRLAGSTAAIDGVGAAADGRRRGRRQVPAALPHEALDGGGHRRRRQGRGAGSAGTCAGGTGCTAGVAVAVGSAGGWAAHGAGSTQERSKAMARIDGQAVLSFMTSPTPSTGSSMRSGAWAVPADTALVCRFRANCSRRRRLEVAAEIVPPGLRGDELVDRRVGHAELRRPSLPARPDRRRRSNRASGRTWRDRT